MALINEPISVLPDTAIPPILPKEISWRGKKVDIQTCLTHWRLESGWWHQDDRRDYFRVTSAIGRLELCYRHIDAQWVLIRHDD